MARAALTNPLEQDPVLKELLQKLDLIETRRGFARWKRHFLRQFESHLEGESIQRAGQKYHAFARRLDRLVLLLKALERLMSTGDLSFNKITVKSRQSLGELQKQLTGMIRHTQALVPGTLDQEMQAGYTKFDMGAVLVRDGFVEYDRLCLCRDVLWHMRESLLHEVADRQLLEEMERYELHLEAFCGIMGTDLGLHGAMLKCRDILRSKDEEFYRYEEARMSSHGGGTAESHPSATTSEYDAEDYWDDEEEEYDDEEEEESDEDDDDEEEEEEEEEEDDDDSYFSDVIELCGMEIPLRMTKRNKDGSLNTNIFEDDDVSELSYDSSWEWSLQVPAPPKRIEKQKVQSLPGLPSAPVLDDIDDDDNEDENDIDDDFVEEEEYQDNDVEEDEPLSPQSEADDAFDEDTVVRHDSVVHPPKHPQHPQTPPGGSLHESEEGENEEEQKEEEEEEGEEGPSSTFMDSKHASTISSLTLSQPSGNQTPPSPSRKARAKSEPIRASALPSNDETDSPNSRVRQQRRSSSTYIPSPSRMHPVERVQMPPRQPPKPIPDNKPTERLKYNNLNDYYHGGSGTDWKKATKEAKQVQKSLEKQHEQPQQQTQAQTKTEKLQVPLLSPEASPTKKKVVVKARLRKKTAGTSDSSEEVSHDGTNSLDINDERVIIRRRGSKKKLMTSRTTATNTSGSVSSQTTNTNSDEASGRPPPRSSSFNESGSDDASSSAGSHRSELDNVRHARRNKPKTKRRPSLRRSGSSRSNSSRKSNELRRMAHRAAKRRGGDDGDDASSLGSRRSSGSQQSRRSQSGKKDPLHNLLFHKKGTKEDDSIDTPNHGGRSRETNNDANDVSPLTSPVTSPVKTRRSVMEEGDYVVKDEARERIKLCYKWYGRLGHPSRDAFKRRVRTTAQTNGSMTLDGMTEEDVDLLPWIHGGARINSTEMTKLLIGDVVLENT